MNPEETLKSVDTVLVIDWPTRDVPEQLALAGFHVVVRSGPGPEDFSAYEVNNGEVAVRRVGRPPERADLIYSYRPLRELPAIIATAQSLQTGTIWTQSGLSSAGVKDPKGCWLPDDELYGARTLVEAAGLIHIAAPYIGDVARSIRSSSR
jgi:predicted CoA-binding protein